jgi:hypothetical protein
MRDPLTTNELDALRCSAPGCTTDHGPLFLIARCHPQAKVHARYEDGVVTLTCGTCNGHIVRIAVARPLAPAPTSGLTPSQSAGFRPVADPMNTLLERLRAQPHEPPCPRSRFRPHPAATCSCWIGRAIDFVEAGRVV